MECQAVINICHFGLINKSETKCGSRAFGGKSNNVTGGKSEELKTFDNSPSWLLPPAGPVAVTTPHLLALCLTQAGEQTDGNPSVADAARTSRFSRRAAAGRFTSARGRSSEDLLHYLSELDGVQQRRALTCMFATSQTLLTICCRPHPSPSLAVSHSECYFNGKQEA